MTGTAGEPSAETPVLVVGAGPVGLSVALVLARFGIRVVVLEQNDSTTKHPKARGCNPRTMELFRQWGIERAVRDRGLPLDAEPAIVVESVAGREIGRVVPEPVDRDSTPSWTCHVTQDVVEEELLSAVRACPLVDLKFNARVIDVNEEADGVVVRAESSNGERQNWFARYVVAADGAASSIRSQLDIAMIGPATLGVWANDFWRADINDLLRDRCTVSFIVVPPEEDAPVSMLFPSAARGFLSWTQLADQDADDPERWTNERARAAIAAQLGATRPIDLMGRAVWRMSSQLAETFQRGRVFLAGDAAHRFPPTGGLGMNTGIQDAHNLAWKLALVLSGSAGSALLDSYEAERRPVAQDNADWSVGNASRITELVAGARSGDIDRVAFWLRDMEHHIHQSGRALGFAYESGALIADGTIATPLDSRRYVASDRPGSRFPHMWTDLSRQTSTLDWFDTHLTLVAAPAASESWVLAAAEAGGKLDLEIDVRVLPWIGPNGPVSIGPRGALLVRPDGHVAWRTSWVPADPTAVIADATATVLSR